MLKIIEEPKFTAEVAVNTAYLKGTLQVTYIARPSSQLRKLEEQAAAEGKGPQGVLHRVVDGFSGVTVDDKAVTSLDELLDWPGVGPAMLRRYYQLLWEEASGN